MGMRFLKHPGLTLLLHHRGFRALFVVVSLVGHLLALAHLEKNRFGRNFNEAPGHPPNFGDPTQVDLPFWHRLVVARWDAFHYEAFGLRGFEMCKPLASLAPGEYPDDTPGCTLGFYPTYGFVGRVFASLTHLPIDYALFAVSLLSSVAFLWVMTSEAVSEALGIHRTYLAAILCNIFTSGFTLVTVQTEPLMLGLTGLTFVLLHQRRFFFAALAAGAATSVRVSAVATGFAAIAAIVCATWKERPERSTVVRRLFYLPLCGSGIIALLTYYQVRFGDPLIYAHAHERAYHHKASVWNLLWPDGRLFMQSIWAAPHDGLFVVAALLWFALGHRTALRRFRFEIKAFLYVYFVAVMGVALYGSAGNAFGGSGRYAFQAFPLFFAMAATLARRVAALCIWCFASLVHYYNGNACFYVSQLEPDRAQKCSFALDGNYRSWDFAKEHIEREAREREKKRLRDEEKRRIIPQQPP
jgi:hypothetical protein